MKHIILLIFIFLNTLSMANNHYIPQNQEEENYLNNIRKKEFHLELSSSQIVNEKINGESINSIIVDLFKNYLKLNIITSSDDNKNQEKIDGTGLVIKTPTNNKKLIFSKKLFGENLYIASKKINIDRYGNLEGKTIYVKNGDQSLGQLDNFLDRENLKVKIKYVDDIKKYENNLSLLSGLYANGYSQKIKIGSIPDTSIGLSKEYEKLIPILNKAITEKYENKIVNHLKKQKLLIQKDTFYKKLSKKEKKYLEENKSVIIGYEINSKISTVKNGKAKGIIPNIVEELSNITGINFQINSDSIGNWEKVSNNFKDKKLNVLSISYLNSKFQDYLFSKKIYNLDVYLVINRKRNTDLVGVVKGTVYSNIAKEYFFKNKIKEYNKKSELLEDFKDGKINAIITANIGGFNDYDYEIEELKVIPINLAFQKNEVILKNIINKALDVMGKSEIDRIIKKNKLEESMRSIMENKNAEKLFKLFIIIIGIGIVVILVLIYKFLSEKKISQTLRNDFLTNLPNRVVFNEFCQFNNKEEGIAVLLDLNNFKQVNDKFNHKLGDKILIEIASILKVVFKKDRIFRISGDEFYCFLNREYYYLKLESLKNEVKNSKLLKKYDVSFSLGYYRKTSQVSLDEAFKYAGMAMREAKENKKDLMITEASEELIMVKGRELKIKDILKDSIEKEFYPVFQPKVNIKNIEDIVGAETLCRWENSELGFISPLEFISLAEDLRIIYLIDYKIAEEAIKTLKEWLLLKKIKPTFRISFNISMQTFDRDDMIEKIEELLLKYRVNGENIEIEITESVLSNNISKAIEKLEKLKEKGIKISLDDFTAGHSTASILPILPIDIVKFDKSLLDLYNKNKKKGVIIYKTLIKMIKDLKIETVAEGIESKDEYLFLKKEGIETAQGYYFGKPVKKNEFKKRQK